MSLQQLLFFDLGKGGVNPGGHRFRVLFQCAFVGLLTGKAQLMQDSPHVIAVMPEVEVPTDDLSYTEGRPAVIGEAVNLRTLDEQVFEDVTLLPRQRRRSARRDGGLERIWATVTEAIFPIADSTHRNTQELSEFLGGVRLSLEQLEKAQSTFFELSSGEVRWEPTVSHPVILPSFTSAEINSGSLVMGVGIHCGLPPENWTVNEVETQARPQP